MGLKVPYNVLGTVERKPLKERHEMCVQLSLQGSPVVQKEASPPTSGPAGPAGVQFHTLLQHGISQWWCLLSWDVCTEGLMYLQCHVRHSGCQLNRGAVAGCSVLENRTPKLPCLGMANGSNLTSFSLQEGW